MNEQAINDAYSLFAQRGYNKSLEDFKSLINSNPQALQDSYSLFVENGYSKKIDDFKTLMGVGATIKSEAIQPGELAGPITQPKPLSPQEIQQLKIKEQPQVIEELKPFLTDENKNIIDIPQYTPSSVEDEMFKLESLRRADENQKGVLTALKNDASRKAVLVQQFINQKKKETQENIDLYAESRMKYYKSISKTEQDLKANNDKFLREVEAYSKVQNDIVNGEIKPYYEEFAKAVNNPILAQSGDVETGAAFEKGFQQSSLRLKNMFGKPEFTTETYQPDGYIDKIISPFRSFAKSFQSTLADQIPAELYSFRSSTISGVSFDDTLARAYKAKNRIIPPRGGASSDWENRIKTQAIQERIDEIGQEAYDKEKADYDKKQVDQKLRLDKESAREKGEAAARMYGIPSSFEEAKQKGILGLGQFTGSMMGQVTGFAAPGMVASALTGGTAIPAAVSLGTMLAVEKGSAYSEGVELLREKYPDLTKEQIYAKNLDADLREASTRTGLTNAALEYVGQLSVFGRFIPKNKVVQLFDKLVDKMPAKGLSRITIGTMGEGLTEWIQRKDTRINNYMAVDGLSFGDALDKAMEQDDSEDFIGGAIGGGGMALIGESANAANRKIARLPYQRAGYTSAQLDLLSKNPENYTVSARTDTGRRYIYDKQGKLVIPEAKKREYQSAEIDADINQTASTGNAGIDSQIDSQANEIINDQERQIGVSGTEQQGQAPVQEGTQQEGGRAQAETGGVVQEEADITVGELLDKTGTYQGKKGQFYKDPQGQSVLFQEEGTNRIYEVGNIDEISSKPISDYGIEYTESVVGTTEAGGITVRGKEYVNKYSDPLMAINQDDNGNIVSVNLETPTGEKRTFRGNIAEDLAYQIKLKQISENNETSTRFNEFLNRPEITTQLGEVQETTTQETTGTPQPISTGTTEVTEQPVAPEVTKPEVTAQPVTEEDPLVQEGLSELEQLTTTPETTQPEVTTTETTSEFDKKVKETAEKLDSIRAVRDTDVIYNIEYPSEYAEVGKNRPYGLYVRKNYLHQLVNKLFDNLSILKFTSLIRKYVNPDFKEKYYGQTDQTFTEHIANLIGGDSLINDGEELKWQTLIESQGIKIPEPKRNENIGFNSTRIAKAYHTAKDKGVNPEFVQAIEQLLSATPETTPEVTTPPTTQEAPTTLNDFKRYFFKKDPAVFNNELNTALGMSEIGWQKAYRKFAKNATPEELRMLDALRGKQPVQPEEITEEDITEEEVVLIEKQSLLDNGYTDSQIQMIIDNPDKYAQVDNKIINLKTDTVVKPKGKKKVQETKVEETKEVIEKTKYADLEKAMRNPDVSLDTLIRIIAGLDNKYSALAEHLLGLYETRRGYLDTIKFSTDRLTSDRGFWGLYIPFGHLKKNSPATVVVLKRVIESYKKREAREKGKNPNDPAVLKEIQDQVIRITLHEIVHAFTHEKLRKALPKTTRSLNPEIRELRAYLKHGDDKYLKNIITLYLAVTDQVKSIKEKGISDPKLKQIYNEAGGKKMYGLTNIHEFLTESFTQSSFQRFLNYIDSPIATDKTMWQSFVDAIKGILDLVTTKGKKEEQIAARAGSVLEAMMRTAPSFLAAKEQTTGKPLSSLADVGMLMGAAAPQDPTTEALIKIAQGLANRGATKADVIEKLKQKVPARFNIDIDAVAGDILDAVQFREQPVGAFDAAQAAADIDNSPYGTTLKEGRPEGVSVADYKQQRVEAIADFLRGKVTNKEQVQDFVLSWNDANPTSTPISKQTTDDAWSRLNKGRQPEPAATAVVKINDVIRQLAEVRARGKAEGVRETTKQFREKLIKAVQESIKQFPLTPNQINSMLAAVKRVNLFTPGSIRKLADRIAKIESDAVYADKIKQARSLRTKIKNLAKPKEMKVSNYTQLARAFLKVDIDYLTPFAGEGFSGVDPIDAYILAAETLTKGFANPKLPKYERIIVSQTQDYINAQLLFKDREMTAEIAENATEEQINNVIEGMSLKEMQALLDEIMMQERAQELQEQLRELDNPDGILNTLNGVDLNTLNADELAVYIQVADNIIANEDYSLVDKFSNKLLAKERMQELNKTLGSVTKSKLLMGVRSVQQITQMLDAIFNVSKYAAMMYNLSGIYDYISGTARVENRKIEAGKKIESAIDKIDSRNMGKPRLRLETEQAKLLMLSELAKYTLDSSEHMDKVHDNIQKSIDRWKEKDEEFGQKIQKIYDKYKNVKSAEEAIEAFRQNDPHVHQLWKFITTEIFTKELADEAALNTASVHNKAFIPFVNYAPSSLKTMEAEAAPPEPERKSAKPVQAGTTKEARRTMSPAQAYDFKDYLNGMLMAYNETLHDIETSKHLQLFNNVANNPDFVKLIGGSDNKNAIISRVISTDRVEKKMGNTVNETISILNKVLEGFSRIGVTTALAGLDQIVLQYPSAALSSMMMLGKDADLFFAAPTVWNPKLTEQVNKILQKNDIAVRGQAHKYELGSTVFDLKSKSAIARGISKTRKGLGMLQKDWLLKPLIVSDVSVAQRSYMAFYLKSLREQGIKAVDLATEHEKANEPSRKQAVAYASLMVSNLQVASTSAGRSEFMQNPDLNLIRKLLFPFSSFPINTKIRMGRALNKMYSAPNKAEGFREFMAVFSEAAMFSGLKIYLLPFYYAAVKAGMEAIAGFEPPEEEEDEEEENSKKWRKMKTQMLMEAIPFNVGALGAFGTPLLINQLNYRLTETEARTVNEFLKDMGEDPMFVKMQNFNKYNEFSGFGQFGIGMDRFADVYTSASNYFREDFVTLDNGYGEQIIYKDSDEIERAAMIKLMLDLAPMFREVRTQADKIQREQFNVARQRQQ
jgi:hypothetical protein